VTPLKIPEVLLIDVPCVQDHRGYFFESWQQQKYLPHMSCEKPFVQDNVSYSVNNVLRGLHFQHPHGQGKLITVLKGVVVDVAVDVRHGSGTFGQHIMVTLDSQKPQQLFIPEGFAHGFLVTSADCVFHYKCTDFYTPACEHTVLWDDPSLNIAWPFKNIVVSPKDALGLPLSEIPQSYLPVWSKK